MYYLKFVATENTSEYETMLSATTTTGDNPTRWEIELPVLACKPDYVGEGDTIESTFSGVRLVSRARRLTFEIEFYPFSTKPSETHNTSKKLYLQNTIFSKSVIYIVPSTINNLPRYNEDTGIDEIIQLLPCRIEPDFTPSTLNKESAVEELTINVYKYRR